MRQKNWLQVMTPQQVRESRIKYQHLPCTKCGASPRHKYCGVCISTMCTTCYKQFHKLQNVKRKGIPEMRTQHAWTTHEEKYLRQQYPTMNTRLIAKALNLPYFAVKNKAYSLCLVKSDKQERPKKITSSKAKELAKHGIYTMAYFNGRESPKLRKSEFRGIQSSAQML